MITYKKLNNENKEELVLLISNVLNNLERKEFFIPFTEDEIGDMFDENKICIYGAFDNDKLVGTAQLYLHQSYVENIKKEINLDSNNVVKTIKLGEYLRNIYLLEL